MILQTIFEIYFKKILFYLLKISFRSIAEPVKFSRLKNIFEGADAIKANIKGNIYLALLQDDVGTIYLSSLNILSSSISF